MRWIGYLACALFGSAMIFGYVAVAVERSMSLLLVLPISLWLAAIWLLIGVGVDFMIKDLAK